MFCGNPALFRQTPTSPGSRPMKSSGACGTTWDVAWWWHVGHRARFSRATAARSTRPGRTRASGSKPAMNSARRHGGGRGFRRFQLAMSRTDEPPHTGKGYQWPASRLTVGDMPSPPTTPPSPARSRLIPRHRHRRNRPSSTTSDDARNQIRYTSVTLSAQNVTLPCRFLLIRTLLSTKKAFLNSLLRKAFRSAPSWT